jgi:hypothetical protein
MAVESDEKLTNQKYDRSHSKKEFSRSLRCEGQRKAGREKAMKENGLFVFCRGSVYSRQRNCKCVSPIQQATEQ